MNAKSLLTVFRFIYCECIAYYQAGAVRTGDRKANDAVLFIIIFIGNWKAKVYLDNFPGSQALIITDLFNFCLILQKNPALHKNDHLPHTVQNLINTQC